jgi:hypothetical protein
MLSEVAYIREQIRLECEAMQRVKSGYAVTSRHDFIEAKMRRLDTYEKQLATHIGAEQAIQFSCEAYMHAMEEV